MTRRFLFALLLSLCLATSAQAQTVSADFSKSLREQGFEIESVGYTWLWRIVVRASNETHEREIVIARGSGQILQDTTRPRANQNSENDKQPRGANPTGANDPTGRGGRDGPGGRGGSGGPGGSGGSGGPGGSGGRP